MHLYPFPSCSCLSVVCLCQCRSQVSVEQDTVAGPVLRGVCDATTLWSVCPRRQWSVGIAIKALKGKGQSQLLQANQGKIALNCMHFQLHLLKVIKSAVV